MEKTQRKIEKFRQREQRILDAALELLLQYGEETVTVEQIANHVDIGKGTIYKHFVSKTEIYMRLLFDYEKQLEDRLKAAIEEADQGNYAAPARAYFESRMSDTAKDRLFQRLEEKMIALKQAPEMIDELHKMRHTIFESMNSMITRRIGDGLLEDVPPHYYYYTYWALTQGAVELFNSNAFPLVENDKEGLKNFIMQVGVFMGNKKDA